MNLVLVSWGRFKYPLARPCQIPKMSDTYMYPKVSTSQIILYFEASKTHNLQIAILQIDVASPMMPICPARPTAGRSWGSSNSTWQSFQGKAWKKKKNEKDVDYTYMHMYDQCWIIFFRFTAQERAIPQTMCRPSTWHSSAQLWEAKRNSNNNYNEEKCNNEKRKDLYDARWRTGNKLKGLIDANFKRTSEKKEVSQPKRGLLAKTAKMKNKHLQIQTKITLCMTAYLRPSFFGAGPVALTSGNFQPVRKWSNETFHNLTKGWNRWNCWNRIWASKDHRNAAAFEGKRRGRHWKCLVGSWVSVESLRASRSIRLLIEMALILTLNWQTWACHRFSSKSST